MKKTFVTIFKKSINVNLQKCVGQIPYYMNKVYNFDSTLVTYKNSEDYPFLKNIKPLKLKFLKRIGTISFLEKAILKYLLKNSRKITILNLYFLNLETVCYSIFYKILNPKGILFIKMDIDYYFLKEKGFIIFSTKSKFKKIIEKILYKIFFKLINVISVETFKTYNYLKINLNNNIFKKIIHLPIGVDNLYLNKLFPEINNFEKKENIILTVGRIGSFQKNNQTLLKAISKINLKNWKVILAGPVENDFKNFLEDYILEFPELKNKIILTDKITNQKQLFDLYNSSKVFCLTSLWESFGTVSVEALYFANYLITTDISSSLDITNFNKIGNIINVKDDNKLANILEKLINNPDLIKVNFINAKKLSNENFLWGKIVDKLYKKIYEK